MSGYPRLHRNGREVRDPCSVKECILTKDHESWGVGCVLEKDGTYQIKKIEVKEDVK